MRASQKLRHVIVPQSSIQGEQILITEPDTLHHLIHVLRVKTGEELECLDGQGGRYAGMITTVRASEIALRIQKRSEEQAQRPALTLVQALIKPARFEWIIEKAVELGADRLVPVVTERSVVRPPADRRGSRNLRWQRLADTAASQCGRASRMEISPIVSFAEFIESTTGAVLLLPTLEVAAKPIESIWQGSWDAQPLTVCIGPEGDFSKKEAESAVRAGAQAVSLGPLTLRSETAAVAALALLQHYRGYL